MSTVATSVVMLFIIVFLGFFLGKANIIRKEAAPDYSNLVIKVTMPATAFLAMLGQSAENMLPTIGIALILSTVLHALSAVIGLLAVKSCRVPYNERGTWLYSCMFSNNAFMGYPLAISIYGDYGLFLMAVAGIISGLLVYSLGVRIIAKYGGGQVEKENVLKLIFTPTTVAVIAGLIVFLSGAELPDIVTNTCSYMAKMTSGLSMFLVGLSLSRLKIREIFSDGRIFILSAIRLLGMPLLVIGIFKLIPYEFDPVLVGIIVLTAALPASAAQSMLAEKYNGNTMCCSRSVFISTLLSVVTLPLIMGLLM